jgi:hypothetical protein
MQSNTGRARIINFQGNQLFYFTNQDLSQPVTINPIGDSIRITAYGYWTGNNSSGFSFGNVQNPDVVPPGSGQSVARFVSTNCLYYNDYPPLNIFTISDYPTMGLENDTTGTFGTVVGVVYDKAGQPVADQKFYMDRPFTTDAAGHYSTRIYSRIITWNSICYERWPNYFTSVQVSPVSYTMIPDSVISRDINLLDTLLVGIAPQPQKQESGLNVFPNPVANLITVSYTTDLTNNPGNLSIDIYDMGGEKMLEKKLENRLGVVSIPVDLANGMYFAVLTEGGKTIRSTRFIVNKAE